MAALALAATGPIAAEPRHRAGVVCVQLPGGSYLHLNSDEATALARDLDRAASALRIGATCREQYTDALTFAKAEAA